ncbi:MULTISPECIES: hypothetical protein [unclassified Microbacterium]|uniref:hypothetical protein n=1 Tax=unclassified Microbacterium TaxID=2609290 RepID=UPI00214B3AF3|nr:MULTISPECIES: hypothetical protein [unclassified Microbacterium]MCR2810290.1 hypothetical protein [Microbacterium sp. zg.B185]WIM19883.1 hypothetical protein QNO12_03490 [Microbacterium sp. zg-B185]
MISVRRIIVVIGMAFTAYLAARGLWWTEPVPQPLLLFAALSLYLVTTWLCILWEPRRVSEVGLGGVVTEGPPAPGARTRLPTWSAALALACAVLVPTAIAVAVGPESRTEPFATWYLGGIGALMTIVMVRRRAWVAWTGIAALALASMIWMGPLNALALGLVGSIVWVAATQLMLRSMDRAARDTAQLAQLQRAASAWQASQTGRQRERRLQVQRALTVAGPILTRTVASGGALTETERTEARLAEGRLRDEIRGPRLLDDAVHAELERARRRGTNVTVLDEGGLEGLDEASLAIIRAQLAETLRTARSDRLYIRTSPHERVAVTVVGRSAAGEGMSDEDAVDLWREIDHPTVA